MEDEQEKGGTRQTVGEQEEEKEKGSAKTGDRLGKSDFLVTGFGMGAHHHGPVSTPSRLWLLGNRWGSSREVGEVLPRRISAALAWDHCSTHHSSVPSAVGTSTGTGTASAVARRMWDPSGPVGHQINAHSPQVSEFFRELRDCLVHCTCFGYLQLSTRTVRFGRSVPACRLLGFTFTLLSQLASLYYQEFCISILVCARLLIFMKLCMYLSHANRMRLVPGPGRLQIDRALPLLDYKWRPVIRQPKIMPLCIANRTPVAQYRHNSSPKTNNKIK